jgi:CheY-like chemotaxis protein
MDLVTATAPATLSPTMTADDEVDASAIRIAIADNHAVVRSVLHALLNAEEGVLVVAEADDLAGARHAVRDHDATVLILGAIMPGGASLEAIATIHAEFADTRIVVLTSTDEPAVVRRALRAGAAGCVLREAADSELVETVRRITRLDRAPLAREPPPDDLPRAELVRHALQTALIADELQGLSR